ncbi:ABC transporter permease [Nonomuraea guangzhouensis]|uniref:FtsX-like permease family protein n=1 Tax=Nonomuraea guangzhouensis TaxID=1291555 RepID=A0ABW4GSR5_9ACTN|nr:FtsX-like permease family protein [Nonomuraea guangzhouensis]
MGRAVLVARLVIADIRRHGVQAAMLLLSITAATAALALGLSLSAVTETMYLQTRQATGGPDLVAVSAGADLSALASLTDNPAVSAHNGPYRIVYATLTAGDTKAHAVVHSAGAKPGPLNRPLVTSGGWVRGGAVVVERGFAAALGVHVGDRVTIAGRTFPIAGIAVTAAVPVYPWAQLTGPGGGTNDYSGLVWLAERDARALASRDLPVTTALDLKLRDPEATGTFVDSYRDPAFPVNFFTWQFMIEQDSHMLRTSQPILVVGSWLLGFLAVTGVAALAAGRAAKQTRRVGLLKAVGATPGLVAVVLLAEYLTLALLADALGLVVARLAAPAVSNPTASLISAASGPTRGTIIATTVFALLVAALSTLGPTVRALHTATVPALADSAHRPRRRALSTPLSAWLPTPLMLGLRLIARRPGRAVLHACGTATTVTMLTSGLTLYVQPSKGYGALDNLRDDQARELLLTVTTVLVALAAVNIITLTWTLAVEARVNMAITRALGATPGQVSAGLAVAQLLPALPGAIAGAPMGIVLYWALSVGELVLPSMGWVIAAVLATLLATVALASVPARFAARRPVAQTLSADAA